MTEIKSDVKETVKAFIQTLVSIIVKEATKKMIKSLTEREKRKFESKIKEMSDDQLVQYLDKNLCFKNALENALKLPDYTHSAKGTVCLMDKLQSIFEETSIRKPISLFSWPAPHTIPTMLVGILLLSTVTVSAVILNNSENNTFFENNTSENNTSENNIPFENNNTSYPNITISLPFANFNSNITNGFSPLTVQFNDNSTNATSLNWDFGDGNNSVEQNPVHTYLAKGNYTVKLTATNGTMNNSTTAIIKVEKTISTEPNKPSGSWEELIPAPVTPVSPAANFNANVTNGVAPLTVQFTDTSTNATSWGWNFGDGQTSSAQDPINTYYSAGTYTVSLNASNANGSSISTKSNLITVDKTTHTLAWNDPSDINYGTALNGTQLNAVSSVPGAFVYTPSAGTGLSAGSHILHVAFTPDDTANYTNATQDVTINVMQATPVINWSKPADRIYGEPVAEWNLIDEEVLVRGVLNAEFIGIDRNPLPGSHIYTPATGTILSAGTHTLHVDFTPVDTTNYTSASKDVQINVLRATPLIYLTYLEDITYGEPLGEAQLNVFATESPTGAPVEGMYTYNPPAGTILSAGTHTLNFDFTPVDTANYTNASKDVQINVLKATPYIFWSDPEDITYGTALSTSQLNAVASVSGSFTYTSDGTPIEVGTVLSEGTHTLNADFTPEDGANYSSTSETNEITILKTVADLNISNFIINPASPTTADQIDFTVVVKNQGNAASNASTVSIRVGGEYPPSAPRYNVPALSPGATYTVTRTLNLDVAQNYIAEAIADPDGNVDESDESNNQAVVTFYVKEVTIN